MPAENVAKTLIRILDMLRCLPRHGSGITASELLDQLREKGYVLEKRTIERDLKTLEEAFGAYIKCNDKAKPFGWRWHDDAEFDVVGMSITEALSLKQVEETLRPMLPAPVLKSLQPRFSQAGTTLKEMAPRNRNAAWANKVRHVQPAMPLISPTLDQAVLETVQECLLHDERLDVEYLKADAEAPKSMPLHPLAIVQRGQVSYLVATARDYPEPALFAVHRILKATRSYKAKRPSPGFDIDTYIEEGHLHFGDNKATGKTIRIKAKVAPWLANILTETPLSIDQKIASTEKMMHVEATVADTRQLQWWILSQGAAMEVLAPKALRVRIGAVLRDASSNYSGS